MINGNSRKLKKSGRNTILFLTCADSRWEMKRIEASWWLFFFRAIMWETMLAWRDYLAIGASNVQSITLHNKKRRKLSIVMYIGKLLLKSQNYKFLWKSYAVLYFVVLNLLLFCTITRGKKRISPSFNKTPPCTTGQVSATSYELYWFFEWISLSCRWRIGQYICQVTPPLAKLCVSSTNRGVFRPRIFMFCFFVPYYKMYKYSSTDQSLASSYSIRSSFLTHKARWIIHGATLFKCESKK